MSDALRAPGNVMAQTRTIDGVHHTLSAWEDRTAMLRYLRSARHAKAMRRLKGYATGRVHGYQADTLPSWSDALAEYSAHGRDVYVG